MSAAWTMRASLERAASAEADGVYQHLERAFAVTMVVLDAARVEAVGTLSLGDVKDLLGRHVKDLGGRIDEAPDQPGTRDSVRLGPGTGNPLHLSDLLG
jgi:hypothetical protein